MFVGHLQVASASGVPGAGVIQRLKAMRQYQRIVSSSTDYMFRSYRARHSHHAGLSVVSLNTLSIKGRSATPVRAFGDWTGRLSNQSGRKMCVGGLFRGFEGVKKNLSLLEKGSLRCHVCARPPDSGLAPHVNAGFWRKGENAERPRSKDAKECGKKWAAAKAESRSKVACYQSITPGVLFACRFIQGVDQQENF